MRQAILIEGARLVEGVRTAATRDGTRPAEGVRVGLHVMDGAQAAPGDAVTGLYCHRGRRKPETGDHHIGGCSKSASTGPELHRHCDYQSQRAVPDWQVHSIYSHIYCPHSSFDVWPAAQVPQIMATAKRAMPRWHELCNRLRRRSKYRCNSKVH